MARNNFTTQTFTVANWDKFQHYKNRFASPAWIRLYTSVLDKYEISLLEDHERAHLFQIWLIAARRANKPMPLDSKWIGRSIQATKKVNLDRLVELGFLNVQETKENSKSLDRVPEGGLEQSRVEESRVEPNPDSGRVPTYSAALQADAPVNEVITLPLAKTGYHAVITDKNVSEWGEAFPGVDVMQELRNMQQWLKVNPKRRKTETGVWRFITGWLTKAQDRPRPAAPGGSNRLAGNMQAMEDFINERQ